MKKNGDERKNISLSPPERKTLVIDFAGLMWQGRTAQQKDAERMKVERPDEQTSNIKASHTHTHTVCIKSKYTSITDIQTT